METAETIVAGALLDAVLGFTAALRAAGVRVGLSEQLDALDALRHLSLDDRSLFRSVLSATLVKRVVDQERFDLLFDLHFGETDAVPEDLAAPGSARAGRRGDRGRRPTPAELDDLVFDVLFGGDVARMPMVASMAVDLHSGITPGTHLRPSWFVFRTLQGLRLPAMLQRLVAAATDAVAMTPLEERLLRHELSASVARFRREVVAAVRRRFAAQVGPVSAAQAFLSDAEEGGMEQVLSLLDAVDPASPAEADIRELHKALHALARKLAVRMHRSHRHRGHGRVDLRHTIRASIGTGGVPVDLRYRRRVRSLPEIVVLVDVSVSVHPYSRFFLELMYAMSSYLRSVRAFTFVADVEEVTDEFGPGRTPEASAAEVTRRADERWAGQVSDYGRALDAFWQRWGEEISERTTVIVLGDARSNGRPGGPATAGEIRRRARRLYWLNPEPRWEWNERDSVIEDFAVHVDGVFECRNVGQFEDFIRHVN